MTANFQKTWTEGYKASPEWVTRPQMLLHCRQINRIKANKITNAGTNKIIWTWQYWLPFLVHCRHKVCYNLWPGPQLAAKPRYSSDYFGFSKAHTKGLLALWNQKLHFIWYQIGFSSPNETENGSLSSPHRKFSHALTTTINCSLYVNLVLKKSFWLAPPWRLRMKRDWKFYKIETKYLCNTAAHLWKSTWIICEINAFLFILL